MLPFIAIFLAAASIASLARIFYSTPSIHVALHQQQVNVLKEKAHKAEDRLEQVSEEELALDLILQQHTITHPKPTA